MRLRLDDDSVLDRGNPGSRPGDTVGLLAFCPRMHGASENDLAAVRLDYDPVGVDFGAAPERLVDLTFDLRRLHPRLQVNAIGDTSQPPYALNRLLRIVALIVPRDLAFEGEPTVIDGDRDPPR